MMSLIKEEIAAKIAEFPKNTFGDEILTDMYGELSMERKLPPVFPTVGEHPRLLIKKEELPALRKNMSKPIFAEAKAAFEELLKTESDGNLPEAYFHERGRIGFHNVDYPLLTAIQAAALNYLIEEDELWGYRAILMMLNYMRSLDLKWIKSDQCREFGYIIYTAACVYDWCYHLLDEKTKFIFTSAVEHKMLRGHTEDTEHGTYGGIKTEMGFPPSKQGAVSGHGSEYQLQRDYMAYAIAIYDEVPTWWEFIGYRFYSEYIPTRSIYYEAGMYPQGMSGYAPCRYLADLYGAWLIRALTGKSPYSFNMARVVHSFAAAETVGGNIFPSGDSNRISMHERVGSIAAISAYLYNDPTALAIAKWMGRGFSEFPANFSAISPAEFLICISGGVEPLRDHHDGIDKVLYNGGYLARLITRNSWGEDSAITLAKIIQRTTANHDHQCCGHFQIYYKGLLTSDQGIYSGYGSEQWANYHQGTISHNCLLVYNPDKVDAEPIYNEKGKMVNSLGYWYCGNQKRPAGEAKSYTEWLSGEYERAELRGVRYGFLPDGDTPKYSYISGDLTKAYPADTVEFYTRSMLTAYTGKNDIPMVFFVFDRVDAHRADFKKTFLLQNPKNPPVINGNTVTLTNGEGKLVLTSLIGGDEIIGIGGSPETNSMIRGKQLCDKPTDYWGRIEISPRTGNKSDKLLNVIYVTDKDSEASLKPKRISTTCGRFEGATAGNITALFSAERLPICDSFEFHTEGGDMDYYIAGLSAGLWTVYLDGKKLTSCRTRAEEGMLTFKAGTGKIKLVLS